MTKLKNVTEKIVNQNKVLSINKQESIKQKEIINKLELELFENEAG